MSSTRTDFARMAGRLVLFWGTNRDAAERGLRNALCIVASEPIRSTLERFAPNLVDEQLALLPNG